MCRLRKKFKTSLFLSILFTLTTSFIFAQVEKDLLDMTLEELMNVKITTAARTPEKIGDIPASVVLITRQDIETHGYSTLAEILENIPGLYAINDYREEGVNFGVRGFWSGVANDNMIILVNDVPQVNDFQSNYPLNKISVPVEAIDRIEVIRGPMSVIYGNGAFYGVINIFTNDFSKDNKTKGNEEEPVNIVSSSIGTEKTKKLFVRVAEKKSDFKYVCNASLYDTYGMDHALNKMTDVSFLLPFLGDEDNKSTGGRLENNEKYFNFSGNFKDFYVDLTYNENKNKFYYLYPSYSNGNLSVNNTTNISFVYRKKLSQTVSINGKLNFTQNRGWSEYDFLLKDFYGNQQIESNALEAEANTFIYPSHNIDIKTGIYYRTIFDVNTIYDLPSFGTSSLENNILFLAHNDDIVTRAIYSQINYRPFPNLTLIAGLRFEQMPKYKLEAILAGGTADFLNPINVYDQDEIEVIPRLAAIYTMTDNHIFKFLYGQAINRPSFFQNAQNLLLEPSKGSLKPESIQTLELNYIASLSSNFTFNFSLFRNTLENLITREGEINDQGDYVTWSANAGKMVTNGVELNLKLEPVSSLRISLSGTYQETDDKRPGYENIEVAYSPKLLGYMKAAYHLKGISFSLTGNYVGAMETFWDESIINPDASAGNRIGDRVDGYFLLGANLRIENIFKKGIYLNIRCYNLLNEQIRYPTFTNNEWATNGTIGFGRTFLVSLGLKF